MTIQEKIYCYINKHINMEILKIREAIKVLNLDIDNIIVEE